MAIKVGEGYLEVETRLDNDNIVKASKAMAQRAALVWGKDWNEGLKKALRESDQQFDVHINKQMESWSALDKQRQAAHAARRKEVADEMSAFTRMQSTLRKQEDADRAEGLKAANAYIAEQNRRVVQMHKDANAQMLSMTRDRHKEETVLQKQRFVDIDRDVDKHGGFWSRTLGRHLLGAFDGVMSLMPSRLEFLFTKTGPLIGGSLAAALVLAMTIFIPALGAMIAGLFFGGFGLAAAVAAVFVGIADDKRVANAAARIVRTFKEHIIYDPSMQNIGQVLADQLDKVNEALHRWAPSINSIIQAGATFLGPLTDGLIAMLDILLPAMDRLANSQFVADLIQIISAGFVQIGAAFQGSFDKFLNDPRAMEGAKMGLRDFFDLVASGIATIFSFIQWLSRMWFLLNNDPNGEGTSPLDRLRQGWAVIRESIGFVVGLIDYVIEKTKSLGQIMFGAAGGAEGVKKSFGDIKDMAGRLWHDISKFFRNIKEWFSEGFGTGFLEGVKEFAGDAFQNVKDFWKFMGEVWTTVSQIFVRDVLPIIQEMLPKMIPIVTAIGEAFRAFLDALMAVAGFVISRVVPILKILWDVLTFLWQLFGPAVLSVIKDVWQGIIDIVIRVWHILTNVFNIIKHLFKGEWGELWNSVKDLFGNIWGLIIDILRNAWNIIWGLLKGLFQGLMTILGPFGSWVAGIWSGIFESVWGWLQRIWDAILQFFVMLWHYWVETWHNIYDFVMGVWNAIVSFIRTGIAVVVSIWQTAWTTVRDFFVGVWNAIWGFIGPGMKLIGELIRAGFEIIVAIFLIVSTVLYRIWQAVWSFIFEFVVENWKAILAFLAPVVAVLVAIVVGAVTWIRDHWYAVWTAIRDFVMMIWNAVWNFLAPIVSRIVDFITMAVNFIRTTWEIIWNAVWSFIQFIWNSIWGFLSMIIERVRLFIHNFLLGVRVIWELIWGVIRGYLMEIWNRMHDNTVDVINRIRSVIETVMETIRVVWNTVWEGIKNVLGGIWDGIVLAVKTGINAVIGILNMGINAINSVLEKLNIEFRIHPITPLADGGVVSSDNRTSTRGNAAGGMIRGPGTATSDSILRRLSNGEFVVKTKSAKKLGYQNLQYMNETGRYPGLAAGGRVGGNNNSLLEQHRNHVHVAMNVPPMGYEAIIQKAAESGYPFIVSSTYRPGSRGSGGGLDHHSEGRAVDFAGFNQDAFATFWEHTAGVIELIHRTNSRDYAIFGGGGGLGGFFNQFLAKGIGWIMDNMLNPAITAAEALLPPGLVGEMGRGVLRGLRDALKAKIEQAIQRQAAMDSGYGGGVAGGAAQWQGTAQTAIGMLGLPGSWLGPLLTLIERESGGNPRAINLNDSNAQRGDPSRGLMQTIGATFTRFKLPGLSDDIYDPLSNIVAGLRYIVATYGSIFNVQQAVGSSPAGYDNGGYLPRGIWNGTSTPEPVFTGSQWDVLKGNMGQGFSGTVNVYVDGVKVGAQIAIDDNNNQIAQDLYRG